MRKDFEFTFSRSSQGNLWRMGRGVVLQEQNTVSQFSSPLSCNFSVKLPQFACILCPVYCVTLLKISNLKCSPLDYPKRSRPSPSLLNEPS